MMNAILVTMAAPVVVRVLDDERIFYIELILKDTSWMGSLASVNMK